MINYFTNTFANNNNFEGDSKINVCLYLFSLYERGVIWMVEAWFNSLTRVSNVEPVSYEIEWSFSFLDF